MNANPHHASSAPSGSASPNDLKDPVCGMTVTAQSGHRSTHEGHTFYFCSSKCQGKFAADPLQYLAPKPAAETSSAVAGTIYTCPMHPEIRQDHPGNCPKCGMTLEPLLPDLDDDDNPELRDFQRRFWWTLPLTGVVFVLAMFGHRLQWFDMGTQSWIELVLALPIVLWAGWPFFVRGAQSVVNRSPNMWTLIGLGTG
ncbi:MAG: heavy metal-binding domain-containing protein, partial [Thiobacillus sp.]|nr:heavy metal-binding domain-containing protein [Thiobacillus sp.]